MEKNLNEFFEAPGKDEEQEPSYEDDFEYAPFFLAVEDYYLANISIVDGFYHLREVDGQIERKLTPLEESTNKHIIAVDGEFYPRVEIVTKATFLARSRPKIIAEAKRRQASAKAQEQMRQKLTDE